MGPILHGTWDNNNEIFKHPLYAFVESRMMRWALALMFIATVVDATTVCVCQTTPCGCTPATVVRGSLLGGTRLWIRGTGFSANGGNAVTVGSFTTAVVSYLSGPSLVVALTPAVSSRAFMTLLPITVVADRTQMPTGVSFVYDAAYTPVVRNTLLQKGVLSMCGNLTTDLHLPSAELLSITVGGVPCYGAVVSACPGGVAVNCTLGPDTPSGTQPIAARVPLGMCGFEGGGTVEVPTGPPALPPPPSAPPSPPPRPQVKAVASGAWSNLTTWSTGALPQAGDDVAILPGVRVVLDCAATTGLLDVEGVIEVQDGANASLTSSHVVVRAGGYFGANVTTGTFVLTLVPGIERPVVGHSVLAVMNGTLELHGRPVGASWVRLTSSAPAGARTLNVDANCGAWPIGSTIAVAPSSTGAGGTEVFTLSGVSPDGRSLQLSAPLAAARAGPFVEVALLDRNVVVRSMDAPNAVGTNEKSLPFAETDAFLGEGKPSLRKASGIIIHRASNLCNFL